MNRLTKTVTKAKGYLVEAQTLEGLSGSPVFVRYTNPTGMTSGFGRVVAYTDQVFLLGLWQSSYEGVPDEILGQQVGRTTKVPVGMGFTIPARRFTEILQTPAFAQERADWVRQQNEATAASTDDAPVDGSTSA